MTPTDGGSNHFGAVDETTKRLVGRCLRVRWLRDEDEAEGEATITANETVKKKNNKLLGVEQSSAMTSTLSVVEVAAHHEKPGVQTPSRLKEDTRRGEGDEPRDAADEIMGNGVSLGVPGVDEQPLKEDVSGVERSPFEGEGEV